MVVCVLVTIRAIALLVPVVMNQRESFIGRMPLLVQAFNDRVLPYVQGIADRFNIDLRSNVQQALEDNKAQAMSMIGDVVNGLLGGGWAVFNMLWLVVITPVVGFHPPRAWDHMAPR